jgi:COP9 signalosome complex subunit 1
MAHSARLAAPTFDLESYSSNYDGPLRPLRLAHIAMHCPSLSRQALSIAMASAKSGKDVSLYRRLTSLAHVLNILDLASADPEWTDKTEDANKRENARLEQELKGYKNNLIRESIRMGQEDLATHLLLTGGPAPQAVPEGEQQQNAANVGLGAAYAAFGKMRDYCTTPTHVASMTLRLIHTATIQAVNALQSGSPANNFFNAVMANANRLRSVGAKDEEMTKLTPISYAAAGVAQLSSGNYRDAAESFLAVPFDLTQAGSLHNFDFTRFVASANDIAIYGGLTALATLDREQLSTRVLGGSFRAFLELEPHMRKAISLFTTAKYRACLDTLQRYYADWNLDIFLGAGIGSMRGSHVDILLARIRQKSITSHLSSYSQISLASLAETFPLPVLPHATPESTRAALETELISLIQTSNLPFRLDAVSGTLVAPTIDARTLTHADAVATANEIERTLLLRLHRVNVTLAGLEVVPEKKSVLNEGGWNGSGKGRVLG